jgi:hypothetical protein
MRASGWLFHPGDAFNLDDIPARNARELGRLKDQTARIKQAEVSFHRGEEISTSSFPAISATKKSNRFILPCQWPQLANRC